MQVRESALWPTRFHLVDYPEAQADKAALVDLCYRLKAEGRSWQIAARAKQGLYESAPDLFAHPEAQGLMQFCGTVICNIFQQDVAFPESWCHITNDGGYHDTHCHIDFARHGVCGIYYLQCSECTVEPPNGINRFYSTHPFAPNDVADIEPREGQLLLFPGYVRHSALPYRGQEDRVVISFNARLTPPEE